MRVTPDLIHWVRGHRHLSAGTLRRYHDITIKEAERVIAQLVKRGVLYADAEGVGQVHRVRYPRPRERTAWWNEGLQVDRRYPSLRYRNL